MEEATRVLHHLSSQLDLKLLIELQDPVSGKAVGDKWSPRSLLMQAIL